MMGRLPILRNRRHVGWAICPSSLQKYPALFTNVLKKFFTNGFENENKAATDMEMQMLNDIKTILTTSRATLVEDSLGVIALFTLLLVGLHLSGAA
jgi:hypothetical protein